MQLKKLSSHDFCLIYVRTVGASEVVRSATERAAAGGHEQGGAERRRVSSDVGLGAQPPENFEVFALHYIPPKTLKALLAIENSFEIIF